MKAYLSFPKEISCHLNNSYVEYQGSSIATSIITSVLTLLISKNKKLIKISGLSEYSNVDEMIEILKNYSNDKNAFGANGSHSYGILDVNEFISNLAKPEVEEEINTEESTEETGDSNKFDPNIKSSYKKPSLIKKIFSKIFKR